MNIDEYSYLWRDKSAGWVLMADDSAARNPLTCAIANKLTKMALVIEDDALYRAVREEMFKNGVPIISTEKFLAT